MGRAQSHGAPTFREKNGGRAALGWWAMKVSVHARLARLMWWRLRRYGWWRAAGRLAFIVFAIGPIAWMVLSSLRPASELFSSPPSLIPAHLTLTWYQQLLGDATTWEWAANSFMVATAAMILSDVFALLAAYGTARFTFRGKGTFLAALVASYVFPPILLVIPVYLLMQSVHLQGTLVAIILGHLIITLPFSIWLMRSFIAAIPRELEEAGLIDGCSELGAFVRLTIPLARAGLLTTSLFVFIMSWTEYLFANTLSSGPSQTLPVGVAGFVTSYDVHWGPIMALGVLTTAPVLVLFGALQRFFERGLVQGAIK